MDAVYILGTGSLANNEELRYSVRALSEYMTDLRDVYIVGEDPGFLPGVVHIPSSDYSPDKWRNAYNKIVRACAIPDLSEEFLLMNDDFFMLAPFEGATLPFYALQGSNGGTCGPHSFHVHCPIRISKELYPKMPFSLEQKACRSPRSFYGNFYRVPPKFGSDYILRVGPVMRPIEEQINKWPFFSVGDSAMLNKPFRDWLALRFPVPSRYEK